MLEKLLWKANFWVVGSVGDNLAKSFNDVVKETKKVAPPLMVLCIVAAGFLFMSGRKGADTAKPWLLYIFGGGALIFGALTIASWIQTTTTF
ncbi:TrbC/VirB2 family protein [Enterococcus sp. AZ072]|uniref:TrbC/VirB2 family protein n=1 Tax=unclassified Enterococcus TaxID=2608891 RepID=UPI003D285A6D